MEAPRVKRRRVAIACTACRNRKSKCDGFRPVCTACREFGYDCSYSQSSQLNNSIASRGYLSSVDERLASTEQLLRDLTSRIDHIERDHGRQRRSPERESERQIPDSFVDEDDRPAGVGFQDATDGVGSIVFSQEEDAGYFGPSSNIAFTRHIVRATTTVSTRMQRNSTSISTSGNAATSHNHMLHVSRPGSPIRETRTGSGSRAEGSIFFLPPADQTLKLIDQYFSNTGLLFPYIHRETFLETYHELMSTDFRKVRRSWLGLLNMVLAMATSATYSSHLTAQKRAAKSEVFYRRALDLCEKQMRSGGSLEVVQFLLLMSQYLQGTERSTQTWNVHGLATKAAYQLGLHSRDALSQYPPLEREMRTRTWYGCVIMDRSLGMTLGRPFLIPESHVKVDMPQSLDASVSSNASVESVAFYNSTITLYKTMGTVLDSLYGGNLGCDTPQDIYNIASTLLHTEQQLGEWKMRLPLSMTLVTSEDIGPGDQIDTGISRYRVILTLRYLNLRVLAHRPILHKFLDAAAAYDRQWPQITTLRDIGSNSLRICIQSALQIVELMAHIIHSGASQRHLGAWWFSLYYTFNAALVLFSSLLIRHDAEYWGMSFHEGDIDIQRGQLQQAVECLLLLDRGNRMTEKCAEYTTTLARMLDSLFYGKTSRAKNMPRGDDTASRAGPTDGEIVEPVDFLDQSQLQMPLGVMDVSELMDPADLDFLNMPSHGLFSSNE